ncbi:MAG: type II toxin-antitoxin system VapC family toxin [Candidatus Woesearchaeota archaeon]|nr:type II toxin-antitoxin system VapC family toxin [Candidatus Woesearchaeota archaeon]
MEKTFIDTDIAIDFFRGYPKAFDFFKRKEGTILFSAITETELLAGTHNNDPEKRASTLKLLRTWRKVALGNPAARIAGDLCREQGMDIPDATIAASALGCGAKLYTRNVKHFKNVPGLNVVAPY